jgi:4'-phosphopantetheinyl transferase
VAERFGRTLASDEIDRAARFRFRSLRQSFIIARGALRHLLGHYLETQPANIRFSYGSNGKPAITPFVGIQFNMTCSGSLAAIALTADCTIGIDLEQVRPMPDMQQIAERFFCPEEAAEIMSLPLDERERAFFCCWTRKEAYIKAVGEGLSIPLDSFRVTVLPVTPVRFVHCGRDTSAAETWTLHDLSLAPGHAAALAYRDRQRSLSIFPTVGAAELTENHYHV